MQTEILDVLIVGAGVSGIGMACTLKTQCPGKTFAILERRQQLGGTWDLFRYPGVRSDSDMLTYGYQFRPWNDFKILADGASILHYLQDTARAQGIEGAIQYGLKITRADWSQSTQLWQVDAVQEGGGEQRNFRCRQLAMCTGYFNYDAGHTPEFPGIEQFAGTVVHPQHWPQTLDYGGKRVVVVGSGATAVTLVPALAETAAHVTMLQRSPGYVMSLPTTDAVTKILSRIMPVHWAFAFARRRNIVVARWIYAAARKWPHKVRKFLLAQAQKQLRGSTDMVHFTPAYMPWDQRLCIVPNADLFAAIRNGKASVATDQIAGFTGNKITLRSGKELEADVLVTATGLDMQAFGGMEITVDGQPYEVSRHMLYKGVMLEGLPNFAWIIGYTNASWTLKADLAAAYICRLIKHLDAQGFTVAVPRDREGCKVEQSIMGNLNSGYVLRATEKLPRQGSRAPWQVKHHYPSDKTALLHEPIDDGVLVFERAKQELSAA